MSIVKPDFVTEAPLLNRSSLGNDLGNTLILSPHPDDESIGCGGLITLLRNQGNTIAIIFMTDGAASHPKSIKFPPKELMKLRKIEAIHATKLLKVDEQNLYFFNQPDGALKNMSEASRSEVVHALQKVIENQKIQTLIIPYRYDTHDDHKATWELAMKAKESLATKLTIVEYPIWLWQNGSIEDLPAISDYNFFRLDITSEIRIKTQAIRAHKTQITRLIDDDPDGFIITEELLKEFVQPYELFFFRKDKDSETLGKEYFDKLYHKSDDPWNFTGSGYEQEKYKQTLSVLDDRYDRVLELGCSIGILSAHLAEKCNYLTAIDISELPLESARKRCVKFSHVNFLKMDISKNFPDEGYDLILISEVGYYLNRKNLDKLFKNCSRHLNKNGHLLMVHYTSFVSEYPLSGKEVHDYFLQSIYANNFKQKDFQVHTGYELVLWEKAS